MSNIVELLFTQEPIGWYSSCLDAKMERGWSI